MDFKGPVMLGLETMPSWAQEIVISNDIWLLEVSFVRWEKATEDTIYIYADGYKYTINKDVPYVM